MGKDKEVPVSINDIPYNLFGPGKTVSGTDANERFVLTGEPAPRAGGMANHDMILKGGNGNDSVVIDSRIGAANISFSNRNGYGHGTLEISTPKGSVLININGIENIIVDGQNYSVADLQVQLESHRTVNIPRYLAPPR